MILSVPAFLCLYFLAFRKASCLPFEIFRLARQKHLYHVSPVRCQLHWLQSAQITHFWVSLWRTSGWSAFESVNSDYPPQYGLPLSNPLRAWIEAGQKTKEFPPPLFFSCLTTWVDVSSHLLGPWTDIYTFASLGSQALLELGLNHTTGFLESPVCRWQIVGLLSPHNHVSQLFIMNLLYKGLYTYRYMPMKHGSIVDLRKNWKILLVPTWVL